MARVEPPEVEGLLGSVKYDLYPFVEAAHRIVEDNLAGTLSEDTLTQIEKFLSAHLATVRTPLRSREEVESARFEYQRTTYGETVLRLDRTGTLASLEKGNVAGSAGVYSPDILTKDV